MIQKAKEYMESMLSGSWGCHDIDHTLRVHDLCLKIGEIENADLEVLELAALLHDIGRPKEMETKGKICHAEYGSKLARSFLEEERYDNDKIEQVVYCISTHRSRRGKAPETLEGKILYDADKLDCIGAVGIGRAFMYAGEIGAKLHNDKGVDVANTETYSRDDTAYREYLVKLRYIKDKMFTKTGREMAEKRHMLMVNFFDELLEETRYG